ncbi:hypothetical protein BASA81_016237, partial [Batrachochytrium salamandrivorans]
MEQQSDAVLERFNGLRVREVQTNYDHTASDFLAKFQTTVTSLKPDERIKLVVDAYKSVELKAALDDPQANK